MTNVHYFFVEKHGYNILTKELASAKNYITENKTKSNRAIDDQNEVAQKSLTGQVYANIEAFDRELNNTMEHHEGFGEACINILNSTENILAKDAKTYDDKNTYIIYDEARDAGDYGITQRNRFMDLHTKYNNRMLEQLNKKLRVIDDYYNRKKDENVGLMELMVPIEVNTSMQFMVHQLNPTTTGLPVEFYFFLTEKDWIPYEHQLADIMNRIYAMTPDFGLRIYQRYPQV